MEDKTELDAYPYYHFEETEQTVKLEARFWNSQGKHIAVVASITKGVDWAAYIGTDAPNSYKEHDTLKYVADWGSKLSVEDASHFFPEVMLPYRG